MVQVAVITLMVGSTSPTSTPCHNLSMQESVLLDVFSTYNCCIYISDSFFSLSRCIYCQLQMQIINVSLPKAHENIMLLKFPDKQQYSLTFQSKQNSVTFPDFPESSNPGHCKTLQDTSTYLPVYFPV